MDFFGGRGFKKKLLEFFMDVRYKIIYGFNWKRGTNGHILKLK